jgi:hypothetical protein
LFRQVFVAALALSFAAGPSFAQSAPSASSAQTATPQTAPAGSQQNPPGKPPAAKLPKAPAPTTAQTPAPKPLPQPKRILGLMPNYRAVSAGTHPPPPTSKEAFKIATEDSFDYSAFVFVGITSLLAEADASHPTFGKGVGGFGDYYWHGWVDKASGNYFVVWAFPGVFHEDERYYAKGTGSIMSRAVYAATRIVITPNYQGHNTFNAAEILGRGVSQAISLSYYPSSTDTPSGFTSKYAYALGRDALTDVFRELWPDISYHVLRMHHTAPGA